MNTATPVFRGTVAADGFIVDHSLIGINASIARVLSVYIEGTVIRELTTSTWVVILPRPVTVRTDRTIGQPLCRVGGRLVGAPMPAAGEHGEPRDTPEAGDLQLFRAGVWTVAELSSLPVVDVSEWIACEMSVVLLLPVEVDAPPVLVPSSPAAAAPPDTRSLANVGAPSKRADALRAAMAEAAEPGRGRRAPTSSDPGAVQRNPRPRPIRSFFANAVLRTPAAQVLGRRHQKFLQELTDQLERGDLREALRNAVPLGNGESLGTTLALPNRRNSLDPSRSAKGAAASIPWGSGVHELLADRYRKAAKRLESEGRLEEAAFVLVDLLGQPLEAVALLERHKRWQLAAEIAEGHLLSPELCVRLWWKAGDAVKAVRVARRHGAFQAAINQCAKSDPDLARQLRIQWVRSLTVAGSYLAAVEVAWPDPQLHEMCGWAIATGIALGGPDASDLRAYDLALRESPGRVDEVVACLQSDDPETRRDRERFIFRFAGLTVTNRVTDRQVASAALRSLVRLHTSRSAQVRTDALAALSRRCDPLLRADLGPAGQYHDRRSRAEAAPARIDFDRPTNLRVHDLVPLPDGSLVVALGELGARLINRSGKTVAHWMVPTHHLVPADNGSKLLLHSPRGAVSEVNQLDLLTRKITYWATLTIGGCASTYDGSTWIICDNDGIAVLDTTLENPVVLWRELDANNVVHSLQRTAASLTSVVSSGSTFEIWTWDLPSFTLRKRVPVANPVPVLANGTPCVFGTLADRSVANAELFTMTVDGDRLDPSEYCISGDVLALGAYGDGFAAVQVFVAGRISTLEVRSSVLDCKVRSLGHRIAVFSEDGQVAIVEHDVPKSVVEVRLTG